jgi:hypothetical protein
MGKVNTVKAFRQKQLISTTHYYKKYGIMCCIVLKFYYLCVVIGDKPVIPGHKFLKYSKKANTDLRFTPLRRESGRGVR